MKTKATLNGDVNMEFFRNNKNTILAVAGVLITVCGILMTVAAVIEGKKSKQIVCEESVPVIEE